MLGGVRGGAEPGHAGAGDYRGPAIDEGKALLVLDVLELHALRSPYEQRVGVGRVDDVGDLQVALAGLVDVSGGRVDAQSEVVEQRALRIAERTRLDLEVRVAHPEPSVPGSEAELGESSSKLRSGSVAFRTT